MVYQLHCQASMLTQIYATWHTKVRSIPCAYQMPLSWGPSELELAKTLVVKFNKRWNEIVDNEKMVVDENVKEESVEEEEIDEKLLDAIEAIALSDAYQDGSDNLFN